MLLENYTYYILIIALASIIILVFRCYSLSAKCKDLALTKENLEIKLANQDSLNRENEIHIKYLEKMNSDLKGLQEAHFNATKSALFDIGKELNKELLNQHKLENEHNKKITEQNIAKVNHEFVKIAGIVQSLGDQFLKSEKSIDSIKKALLNPTGAGQLAEITLENILSNSGLIKDVDFFIQPQFSNSDNKKLRPDAIVIAPSGSIIIDAKSSGNLVHFEENNIDVKESLIRTMYQHLKSLSSKEYGTFIHEFTSANPNSREEFDTKVTTVMFLPTESMVEKISKYDQQFINKCWQNNIYVAGPVGLMNILSLAKLEIQGVAQAKNYQKIISEIQKLVDSLCMLVDHSSKVGSAIQTLVGQYDKFVGSFNGNFLRRIKNISKLGLNSSKNSSPLLKRYQLISTAEILDIDSEDKIEEYEKQILLQEFNSDMPSTEQ